eukprot:NODE_25373_length_589_cov_4.549784.p3 GENE.NODE_25373_length_589_cov_4.549784~~NODE_25373_length_589_cov_4.549784.p3  ORF type:complete len:76 (-),score=11.31 NODE_25373_length_589_cov_4.549784:360-587(-)
MPSPALNPNDGLIGPSATRPEVQALLSLDRSCSTVQSTSSQSGERAPVTVQSLMKMMLEHGELAHLASEEIFEEG